MFKQLHPHSDLFVLDSAQVQPCTSTVRTHTPVGQGRPSNFLTMLKLRSASGRDHTARGVGASGLTPAHQNPTTPVTVTISHASCCA
jgi:hypothetical protein